MNKLMNIDNLINPNMKNTFIFIDGSYYCFYRYYALLNWWKNAKQDVPLNDPYENTEFVEKFKKTFVDNIKNIPKKLHLNKNIKPIFIVGRDCKRENIWRNEICNNNPLFCGSYKGNRDNSRENGFMGGPFFKMVYEKDLFKIAGVNAIVSHPKLEADDCIALSVKYILEKYENSHIYIITSDKDYLQISEPRIELYSLNYKKLTDQKSSSNDPKCDLFCKILMGDPSDNIKPIFKKCGIKTAMKCYEDKEYFEEKMKNENAYEMYKLNKKLIDFDEIPEDLVNEFMQSSIMRKT